MPLGAIVIAVLKFLAWEAAIFAVSVRLARLVAWESAAEEWLAIIGIEITLESSFACVFTFAKMNSLVAYWVVAIVCLVLGRPPRLPKTRAPWVPAIGALASPLVLLSFRPVEEIDSINHLHYMIDWMANRANPYVFATNYVAFWELSFLPVWTVTRVDLFFPLLELKSLVLMVLALWLLGREWNLPRGLLSLGIFGALLMRHYWIEYSGVPTLKNDILHGVGFVLLTLVIVRAARQRRAELLLLALGSAFASVKYTGMFFTLIALAIVLWFAPRRGILWVPLVLLLTSGHYYLHNFIRYGSPFYPFQINIGPIHLPGTADLSYTSILYNWREPGLWRVLFLPRSGLSPAGPLFPAILAGVLIAAGYRCARAIVLRKAGPLDWTAFCLLCGWMLYFRSVFGAGATPGDLTYLINGLDSLRYVDGVLAVSELFLLAFLAPAPWLAAGIAGINTASRLYLLYSRESVSAIVLIAVAGFTLAILWTRRGWLAGLGLLVIATPFVVELNRRQWTTEWNDLKPYLARVRGKDLAELALPEAGYFAGHVVAAGNPVDPAVRSLLPEEVDSARPRYLAVMLSPGSPNNWRERYGAQLSALGYQTVVEFPAGALLEKH
jgi:hypothetical protein